MAGGSGGLVDDTQLLEAHNLIPPTYQSTDPRGASARPSPPRRQA